MPGGWTRDGLHGLRVALGLGGRGGAVVGVHGDVNFVPFTEANALSVGQQGGFGLFAFTYGDEDTTFAELDEGAICLANAFVALGEKPGERVPLLRNNHPTLFEVAVGAARVRSL